MKKIMSFFLAILMILSSMLMIACSGDRDNDGDDNVKINVKSEIKAATNKMNTVNSCSGTSKLKISVKAQGVTLTTELDYQIKFADLQTAIPKRYADVKVTAPGQSQTGCIYTEGEWDYCVVGNEKYKSRVEENKDKECDEYSDSVYENATVRKTDKGTSIKMSFTPQQFKEYFAGMYETIVEMFSLDGMEDYMTLSDAGLKVVIDKEGYVIEEAVSFKITISDGTESVILEISNEGTYKSFNEPVTITPPQGYLSFTEKMDGDII